MTWAYNKHNRRKIVHRWIPAEARGIMPAMRPLCGRDYEIESMLVLATNDMRRCNMCEELSIDDPANLGKHIAEYDKRRARGREIRKKDQEKRQLLLAQIEQAHGKIERKQGVVQSWSQLGGGRDERTADTVFCSDGPCDIGRAQDADATCNEDTAASR